MGVYFNENMRGWNTRLKSSVLSVKACESAQEASTVLNSFLKEHAHSFAARETDLKNLCAMFEATDQVDELIEDVEAEEPPSKKSKKEKKDKKEKKERKVKKRRKE